MVGTDPMRERIASHPSPRRGRGGPGQPRLHALQPTHRRSRRAPAAHRANDDVQVLWWRGTAWAAPGDFGPVVMPLDQALAFVAAEGFFWISA